MGAIAKLVALVAVVALAAPARADDSETPRAIHVGAVVGMGMSITPDPADPSLSGTPSVAFLSGLDIGVQHLGGDRGFSLDADILPIGSIYRARGAFIVGHGFTTAYREPCIGPPGYSCAKVWDGRQVRSLIGLELGASVGYEGTDTTATLEVGLAFRSQFSFDLTALYDPIRAVPGGGFDFEWQIGAFYLGFDLRGLAAEREPMVLTTTLKLGWAKAMWR